MLRSFPRLLACCLVLAVLPGCAHQAQQGSAGAAEAHAVDDASELEIAPLTKEPEVGTPRHRLVAGLNSSRRDVVSPDVYDHELTPVEVLRTGRYQLVTMRAPLGQRHLLEQIVNVRIPPSVTTTVGDGMRYTLKHTGYSLCSPEDDLQRWLFSRPLPSTHYRLGPLPLREALQVLAGDTWELEEDSVRRQVCYEPRDIRTVESIEAEQPEIASAQMEVGDE